MKYKNEFEAQRTFLEMFNPKLVELPVDLLKPMPENEKIHGPILHDEEHENLVSSVKEFGQLRFIIVFKLGSNELPSH